MAVISGYLSEATADAFARYIIAEQEYLRAVQRVLAALRIGDAPDAAAWSQIQDRFFRELQSAGKTFGLSPDSRML